MTSGIDDPHSFFAEAAYQGYCACCGYYRRAQVSKRFEAHHVLEARHCKLFGAPLHDPDNALRLCAKSFDTCHERHTTHQELIPLACLRDENIAFVLAWIEPGPAYEYLRRYYGGTDPRVDRILEQL